MTFWQFRDRLGQQVFFYDPRFRHHPGDDCRWLCMATNKDQRKKKPSSSPTNSQDQPQKKKEKRKTWQSQTKSFEPENDDSCSESDVVVMTTSEKVTPQQFKQLKKKKNRGNVDVFKIFWITSIMWRKLGVPNNAKFAVLIHTLYVRYVQEIPEVISFQPRELPKIKIALYHFTVIIFWVA